MSTALADEIRAVADDPTPAAIKTLRRLAVQVERMEIAMDEMVREARLDLQRVEVERALHAFRTRLLS